MSRIKGIIDQPTRIKVFDAVGKSKTLTDSDKSLIKKSLSIDTD